MRVRLMGGRRRVIAVAALGVAVLALAAGGIAYAAIPDSAGVYTACKLNSTGTIRLIDPSLGSTSWLGHCSSLETQISWNQQGQPGPAGPQGSKGDAGPAGAQGPQGPKGDTGAAGADGVSVTSSALSPGDPNCPNGGSQFTAAGGTATYACTGATGPAGPAGPQGPAGPSASADVVGASAPGPFQTSSTNYVLNANPAVMATIPASGRALVTVGADITPVFGNCAYESFSVDGGLRPATDAESLSTCGGQVHASATYLISLSPGSHIIAVSYRSSAGVPTWQYRTLIVTPLP